MSRMSEALADLLSEADVEFGELGVPVLGSYSVSSSTQCGHIVVMCGGRTIGVLELVSEQMLYRVAWPRSPRLRIPGWPHERPDAAYAYLLGYWERAMESTPPVLAVAAQPEQPKPPREPLPFAFI